MGGDSGSPAALCFAARIEPAASQRFDLEFGLRSVLAKQEALAALRAAEKAGWRMIWRFYRDIDPAFDSIRNEPEFKAVFADIERDMARQRAELAARPKDAPLDLGSVH